MPSTPCPDCDQVKSITDTGEYQDGHTAADVLAGKATRSSRWWTIEVHKHPDRQELCPGSGKRV